MNKAELIEALAQRSGLQKQKAKKLLEAYVDIVTEAMSHNEEIVLIGFGTLIPRPQTERLPHLRKIQPSLRHLLRLSILQCLPIQADAPHH